MSPTGKSFQPLAGVTSRRVSCSLISRTTLAVSNCPQPSLKGIQPMMQGNCFRDAINSSNSASNGFADSGERVIPAFLPNQLCASAELSDEVISGADLSPLGIS